MMILFLGMIIIGLTISLLDRKIKLAEDSEAEQPTRRRNAVAEYRKKPLQHKELESLVRTGPSLSLQTLIPFLLSLKY